MKNPSNYSISLRNVDLEYELHKDKTDNFKEYLVNLVTRRNKKQHAKEKFLAINGLTLEIAEGERVGIIGFNGAGKSTLLKVISGILKPTRGQIDVQGNIQPLIEIGAGFAPDFSGRENIYFNSYMLGFTKQEVEAKVDEIIEFAELGEFIDVPVKYYSSGMAVRLAFTIATSIRPELLLIDEMLGAGDAYFIQKARKRMDLLMKEAKIIVMVTHDLGMIESEFKRTVVMLKGRMVFDGPTSEALAVYKKLVDR